MKTFYAVCISSVLVLIVITVLLRGESNNFYGIADAKEIVLSSETPVEIKKIRIVPGQAVKEGDTLVELSSQDLDLRISTISHELDEIKTRKATHATMSKAEIRQLKVQQEERANELKAQIQQLESQYEINRKLVRGLKSIKKSDIDAEENSDTRNPLTIRIENMKRDLSHVLDSSQILVDQLNSQLSYTGDPLQDEVRRLQAELTLLHGQKQRLFIPSQINGIIGAVNFKDGEKVSPFTPIATVHSESPSFVRGYIHENVYSTVSVFQKVSVSSVTEKGEHVIGEVVGVGSRIVEYPIRLRKMPDIQMWGREISIKIPVTNKFLLGEKVIIAVQQRVIPGVQKTGNPFMSNVYAAGNENIVQTKTHEDSVPQFRDIVNAAGLSKKVKTIEASASAYLADLNLYLVVSDDTKGKRPALFLMDSSGIVVKETFIDGLAEIRDMESVTQNDRGIFYIASSQSCSKKGAGMETRKLLVRVKRKGDIFSLDGKIVFLDMLVSAARLEPGKDWARFITSAVQDCEVDVEAIACRGSDLYVGFKSPLLNKKSVILKINGIDDLFSSGRVQTGAVSLWKTLSLRKDGVNEKAHAKISDMLFLGDTLFVLSRTKIKEDGGEKTDLGGDLWKVAPGTDRALNVRAFPSAKPEGLCYNASRNFFLITCDNGDKKTPQYMFLRIIQ